MMQRGDVCTQLCTEKEFISGATNAIRATNSLDTCWKLSKTKKAGRNPGIYAQITG